MFKNKALLITGGTGTFGRAILDRFLDSDIREIRIFSRDEKKNFIDLADKINDAINLNDKIRKKMSFRAINRAKQFSWDVCVNKTVSFLKQIAQNNFS